MLEIGCGSGVLLAAAGALGAASLCGVDVERAAVAATLKLLRGLELAAEVEVRQGDLFTPVDGRNEVSLRTEREATSVAELGCTAEGQSRPQ